MCVRMVPLLLACMAAAPGAWASEVTYYYTDPQGTVLATTDSGGGITTSADYRPYGTRTTGSDPGGPGYTSHVSDPDTGLLYMQARYYDATVGRFLSIDPVGPEPAALNTFSRYVYANDNPARFTDPTGMCADHYANGTCKVLVDPSTGAAGAAAGKQLEAVLNKYDKSINALGNTSKFTIRDRQGHAIGSLSGQEIKAVWNGTSVNVSNKAFNNGGAGGGTGGTWTGTSFKGMSTLQPAAVSAYANAAVARNDPAGHGISTLIFHELGHETHFGEALTRQYPVTPSISWPREQGTSSAAERMANTVTAPFDCSIAGGCQ